MSNQHADRRLVMATVLTTALLVSCFNSQKLTAEDAVAEATKVEVFGKSEMTVPSAFEKVDKRSRILDHEFKATADGVEETARVTMMASGGGVDANVNRWKGQFTGGDETAKKVEKKEVGEVTVHIVDTNGNFAERMGGGPFSGGKMVQRRDYAMTGAILEYPDGKTYFVKMIGPMKVVQTNRKPFMEMLDSIKAK